MKQNIIKYVWIILVLLVVVIAITTIGNASAVNPNSERIAELSYELSELEAHKNICLDNLPYQESLDNANWLATHCVAYDERIMAVEEEIENLKVWRPAASETETAWTSEVVENREPWKLTASWDSQEMPEIKASTSHERFKELSKAYWLNPSTIREVENKYNLREWIVLCLVIAETSWGKAWYGKKWCWNFWNVGNNDRWDRRCYSSEYEWLSAIGQALSNKYLGRIQTLGCLSNAGSCTWWEDLNSRYATSNWNWERTMLNCLNKIYSEDLGEIDPSRFNVRRVFTIYQ